MKTLIAVLLTIRVAVIAGAAIPFERAVTAPAYGPSPGGRAISHVTTNGAEFLVVWNDVGRASLYAARVSAAGAVLDETGIRIEPSKPLGTYQPFWAGNAYVLFWSEASGLKSARIDGEGGIIDPPHAVLDRIGAWSVATNGSRFVVAYNNRIAVLDLSGRVIERDIVVTAETGVRDVTVTSNGHAFLVSWLTSFGPGGGPDMLTMPLDASGHPAGTAAVMARSVASFLQASNGNEYLAVVTSYGIGSPYGIRFSANGELLNTAAMPGVPSSFSALLWDGFEYIYTYAAGPIRALRLTSGGAPFGGAAFVTTESATPVIASIGQKLLLAWDAGTLKAEILDAATMSHGDPAVVSWSATEQLTPRIAFSGRNYLTVWQERNAIVAARMDASGRTLELNGFKVTSDSRAQTAPTVVFDGAGYLVAWRAGSELWMNRVDADTGALLNGDGARIAAGVCAYDVATDGSAAMVAFSDCTTRRLQAMRINRALLPIDAPLTLTPPGMKASNPSIAWSGTQWLVAFEEQIDLGTFFEAPPSIRGNIRAARITPSMTLLDTQPINVASSDADLVTLQSPHAASNGADYLIAWTRGAAELRARHLLPNGTLGATTVTGGGTVTSAIWTGTDYAVGVSSTAGDALGLIPDSGTMIKISATVDAEGSVAFVAASGRLTGAYTRRATEPLYGGVLRVFIRDARPLRGRVAGR